MKLHIHKGPYWPAVRKHHSLGQAEKALAVPSFPLMLSMFYHKYAVAGGQRQQAQERN